MITRVDEKLRCEAVRYAFRFGCEWCFAFDPERRACAHGFPNEQHVAIDLASVPRVVFCKEFELA